MEENAGVVLEELLDQVDLNLKVPYLTQVCTQAELRPCSNHSHDKPDKPDKYDKHDKHDKHGV